MNSKLIEANTLVVNHRLQYNVVYCDLVKGYFLSNKFTFDYLNTLQTSVLIDHACCWFWNRGNEKEANIILNSYLYNYKTFLHNYNNLFN